MATSTLKSFGRLQVACVQMMDGWIHQRLACMACDPVCAATELGYYKWHLWLLPAGVVVFARMEMFGRALLH